MQPEKQLKKSKRSPEARAKKRELKKQFKKTKRGPGLDVRELQPGKQFKKVRRGPGLSFGKKLFRPHHRGGRLEVQDFIGYGQLSRQRAILLALSIAVPYLAIVVAVALNVSTTIAAVISIPLVSVFVIAGAMYWLARL